MGEIVDRFRWGKRPVHCRKDTSFKYRKSGRLILLKMVEGKMQKLDVGGNISRDDM
jgi:hypothetical protein